NLSKVPVSESPHRGLFAFLSFNRPGAAHQCFQDGSVAKNSWCRMEFQTVCVFGEEAPLSNRPQPRFTVIGRLFKAGCDQEKEYFSLILRLQKFLQQSPAYIRDPWPLGAGTSYSIPKRHWRIT
ncbi:hypothetical protein, partial [Rhizobium rhizogenes]|uniref:hypothetical protein n=1 Tax=Rhizobium rhizogenes TaxID=359 RepID=UPI001AEE22B0